jgi:hypothetical protein
MVSVMVRYGSRFYEKLAVESIGDNFEVTGFFVFKNI